MVDDPRNSLDDHLRRLAQGDFQFTKTMERKESFLGHLRPTSDGDRTSSRLSVQQIYATRRSFVISRSTDARSTHNRFQISHRFSSSQPGAVGILLTLPGAIYNSHCPGCRCLANASKAFGAEQCPKTRGRPQESYDMRFAVPSPWKSLAVLDRLGTPRGASES